jgi:hypothetical protein
LRLNQTGRVVGQMLTIHVTWWHPPSVVAMSGLLA